MTGGEGERGSVMRDAEAELAAAKATYLAAQMRLRKARAAWSTAVNEDKRLARVAARTAKEARDRTIYQRRLAGGGFDDISREFHVSKAKIGEIIRREHWRAARAAFPPGPAG